MFSWLRTWTRGLLQISLGIHPIIVQFDIKQYDIKFILQNLDVKYNLTHKSHFMEIPTQIYIQIYMSNGLGSISRKNTRLWCFRFRLCLLHSPQNTYKYIVQIVFERSFQSSRRIFFYIISIQLPFLVNSLIQQSLLPFLLFAVFLCLFILSLHFFHRIFRKLVVRAVVFQSEVLGQIPSSDSLKSSSSDIGFHVEILQVAISFKSKIDLRQILTNCNFSKQ